LSILRFRIILKRKIIRKNYEELDNLSYKGYNPQDQQEIEMKIMDRIDHRINHEENNQNYQNINQYELNNQNNTSVLHAKKYQF
jgi:hypothetical protein